MNPLQQYGATERYLTEATLYPDHFLSRVVSQYKDYYKIVTESGECMAEVSGKFRYDTAELSDFPAVGDFVMCDRADDSGGNAIIHQVLTRKSVFARAAVDDAHQAQVVTANIDLIFLCMALNADYNLSRLERYLSVAWNSGAAPVVVLTKSDLCESLSAVMTEISAAAPGTDVVVTSSHDQASCDQLFPYPKEGVTASFIGSSGVGKSTLINRLAGEERLATSEIRKDGKGRHTSTRRELVVLPQGGIVIDTPGMRELGIESVNLAKTFSDIDDLIANCRFRDCTHTSEPGCAVREAIETGALDTRRFENYQKLKREARYDGLSFKEIETQKLNAMFADVGGMKHIKKHLRHIQKRRGH